MAKQTFADTALVFGKGVEQAVAESLKKAQEEKQSWLLVEFNQMNMETWKTKELQMEVGKGGHIIQ